MDSHGLIWPVILAPDHPFESRFQRRIAFISLLFVTAAVVVEFRTCVCERCEQTEFGDKCDHQFQLHEIKIANVRICNVHTHRMVANRLSAIIHQSRHNTSHSRLNYSLELNVIGCRARDRGRLVKSDGKCKQFRLKWSLVPGNDETIIIKTCV